MKKILFVLALFAFSCKDKEDQKVNKNEYEQQKESLLQKEQKSPKSFLSLSGDDKRNIWGKTVFKGTIKNNATVAIYKNVRVKLLYYKSGELVTNHEELFEEEIRPGDELEFKAKYKTPRGTDSVAASIMSATALK